MIVHVVLFKPRPSLSGQERDALAQALTAAIRDIPSIRRARVGPRIRHGRPYEQLMRVDYSYCAMLEFDTAASLSAYLEHPAHEALATRFFEVFEDALMYDYDMADGEGAVERLL